MRASRIRLLNLAEEGDKRAERVLRLLEHPEQTLNSRAARAARVPDDLGDAARHRARAERSAPRASRSASCIEIIVVFTFSEVAPKTFAVQHTERAVLARLGAARVRHAVPAVARADARVHRARQRRAARARACARGPFVTEEEILTMADVAAPGGVDRDRGTRAHPLDLRVRRHRRARGDGAAPRHGRGRGRRDGRRGDPHRDQRRQVAAARVRRDAPTTSSASCS